MSDFEFLSAFFGLLIGLILAELATKFADAIDAHRHRPIGLLTPLLALFVMLDITGFWLFAWSMRTVLTISWHTVFMSMTLAITYFLAASLIFPREPGQWSNLDEHYWARKRIVLGGVTAVNLFVMVLQMVRVRPSWSDGLFFFYQGTYFGPLAVLLWSRTRRVDIAMFAIVIISLIIAGFDLLPSSQWSNAVGLSSANASTSAVHTR